MGSNDNNDTHSIFEQFTNQFPVSKTLRFELKPVGETQELIRQIKDKQDFNSILSPLILDDKKRATAYKEAKKLIDDLHRDFLNFALNTNNISQERELILVQELKTLFEEYEKYKKSTADKKNKDLITGIHSIQKELAATLTKILDDNAPEFWNTLSDKKRHLEGLEEQQKLLLTRKKEEREQLARTIKVTAKTESTILEKLRNERAEFDKEIKTIDNALKEYAKILKFKFDNSNQLHKKTDTLFTILRLYYIQNDSATRVLQEFDGFHSYFVAFNLNRTNVYDIKGTGIQDNWHFLSTSVAHRLFEENIKFHFDNIIKWEAILKMIPNCQDTLEKKDYVWKNELQKIEEKLNFSTNTEDTKNIFTPQSFCAWFSQDGIDQYNEIIGGRPAEEGKEKNQGLNELINLTRQQAAKGRRDFPPLQEFHKQILSERDSEFLKVYTTNEEMIQEINEFAEQEKNFLTDIQTKEKANDLSFAELLEATLPNQPQETQQSQETPVYLGKESLPFFSQELTGNWQSIENWCLHGLTDNEKIEYKKTKIIDLRKLEQILKKEREYDESNDSNSTELADFYEQHITQTDTKDRPWLKEIDRNNLFASYFSTKLEHLIEQVRQNKKTYLNDQEKLSKKKNTLEPTEKTSIKKYLETSQDLFRFFRNLSVHDKKFPKNIKQNEIWKESVEHFMKQNSISNIYNKTRNFLTKKGFSQEKFKLNFENVSLADGWDRNKEKDNTAVLLRKDGQYFLAIMDKKHPNIFESVDEDTNEQAIKGYEKVKYKLLPGANKMLPKVFFSEKNIGYYAPTEDLKTKYDQGLHKKGKNFDLDFCHQLIDFFKQSIDRHPDWSKSFNWQFSDTQGYEDLSYFYREVEAQGYNISFSNVSEKYINQMITEKKLYLFQIYNKDFSKNRVKERESGRTDNLHTLFWKSLFSPENLNDTVIKLNGKAELFYRPASISYSQEKRQQGHHAEDLKNKFNYPILKDKRYSEDKILFHCPITLNFKPSGQANINKSVNQFLQQHANQMNVIGIDRGERNLLYYSVINQQGDILEQGTWNTIKQDDVAKPVDYHAKLDDKEKKRAGARENWETIENIKELKAGYLSQVIHQLSQLIIKHNAIVVLEDLNFGFKRGRFKIEKQIYQKFEKALIDKLNYLVDKRLSDHTKNGHCLKAYQLTNKFESFQKLGKQSGILFYTAASYTSKTDPITGYMQTLYPNHENVEQAQVFFSKFDSVVYNGEGFEFVYNLKNLQGLTGTYEDKKEIDASILDKKWTIHSKVERSRYDSKTKQHKITDVNRELETLFTRQGFDLEKGKDYKKDIVSSSNRDKFEENRFLFKLTAHFKRLLSMRVTDSEKAEKQELKNEAGKVVRTHYIHNAESDFIYSPVFPFYDSRKIGSKEQQTTLPEDSDANGAYNIARKGIIILERIRQTKEDNKGNFKPDLLISKTHWQQFAQNEERVKQQTEKWKNINL